MLPGNPGTAGFGGGYQASPHAGFPDGKVNAEPTLESRARNALLLGILAIPLSILAGIPAILVGVHALRRIDAADGALKGRRLAWGGITLGGLSVAAFVALVFVTYR